MRQMWSISDRARTVLNILRLVFFFGLFCDAWSHELVLAPYQHQLLKGTDSECPCIYSYFFDSGSEAKKVALYLVDGDNFRAVQDGNPFLYMAGFSVLAPGLSQQHVDYGPTTPGRGLHLIVHSLSNETIALKYAYNVVPAATGVQTFASGSHIVVPFERPGPLSFSFQFFFSDKRCYVGAFIMNQAGYQNFNATGQPYITFARRFFYLGLDTTVKFQGYLPKHEQVFLVLQNVNQKTRRDVDVTYVYNIVYQEQPRIFSITTCPSSGGQVTLFGQNFGPSGTVLSPNVSIDGKPCTDAIVSVAHYEMKCNAPAGTGEKLDVKVAIEGFDSGDSGTALFSYSDSTTSSIPSSDIIPGQPSGAQFSLEQVDPAVPSQNMKPSEASAPHTVVDEKANLGILHASGGGGSLVRPSVLGTYLVDETPGTEDFAVSLDQMRFGPLVSSQTIMYEKNVGFVDFMAPKPTEAMQLSQELQNELKEMQFPSSCKARKSIAYKFSVRMGLGAHLNFLTIALRFSYERNWTLVTSKPNPWLYWETCSDGYECLFEPISSCNQHDTDVQEFWESMGPGSTEIDEEGSARRLWVPPKYAHMGVRWFRAQLLRYLFKPKSSLLKQIEDMKARMGWKLPAIGLHMRRRQEKVDEGEIFMLKTVVGPLWAPHVTRFGLLASISDYMNAVKAIANRTGVRTVFITSDAEFVSELGKYEKEGFTFLYDKSEKRDRDFHEADIDVVATIGSLWLLGECNYWVGTFSSAYGRLGNDLQTAKRLHSMAVSIDIPWIAYP